MSEPPISLQGVKKWASAYPGEYARAVLALVEAAEAALAYRVVERELPVPAGGGFRQAVALDAALARFSDFDTKAGT